MKSQRLRFVPCRGCGKSIYFLKSNSGKSVPVDVEGVEPDDWKFEPARHTLHFRTCTKPDQFRKANRPSPRPHWQDRN